MLLDVDYILLGLPGIALSLWALWRSVSAGREGARRASSSGFTGAKTAGEVMRAGGMEPVEVVIASGPLANHYDRSRRVLQLSRSVFEGRSPAAIGVAAHEAGHSFQHAAHFPGLMVRVAIVPLATLGSITAWFLIFAGLLLGIFRFTVWGLAVFSITVLLQLMNLPIELDATRRARQALHTAGVRDDGEDAVLLRVMNAAAWSPLATVFTGVFIALGSLIPTRRDIRPAPHGEQP